VKLEEQKHLNELPFKIIRQIPPLLQGLGQHKLLDKK
jgi:hypothetical protein